MFGLSWGNWRRAAHALERFLRRAARQFGRIGYITVWEQAGARLHLNLILYGRTLTQEGLDAFLRRVVVRCGFAPVRYCAPVESKPALAGYLCKASQLPLSAPLSWQRLRASRGFLDRRFNAPVRRVRLVPPIQVQEGATP